MAADRAQHVADVIDPGPGRRAVGGHRPVLRRPPSPTRGTAGASTADELEALVGWATGGLRPGPDGAVGPARGGGRGPPWRLGPTTGWRPRGTASCSGWPTATAPWPPRRPDPWLVVDATGPVAGGGRRGLGRGRGAGRPRDGTPVSATPAVDRSRHPVLFAGVVGQERAVARLWSAARRPVHAYLFHGPPGSGKRAAARGLAAALLCPDGGCGVCNSCRRALAGTHPDLVTVERTGAVARRRRRPGDHHPGPATPARVGPPGAAGARRAPGPARRRRPC